MLYLVRSSVESVRIKMPNNAIHMSFYFYSITKYLCRVKGTKIMSFMLCYYITGLGNEIDMYY